MYIDFHPGIQSFHPKQKDHNHDVGKAARREIFLRGSSWPPLLEGLKWLEDLDTAVQDNGLHHRRDTRCWLNTAGPGFPTGRETVEVITMTRDLHCIDTCTVQHYSVLLINTARPQTLHSVTVCIRSTFIFYHAVRWISLCVYIHIYMPDHNLCPFYHYSHSHKQYISNCMHEGGLLNCRMMKSCVLYLFLDWWRKMCLCVSVCGTDRERMWYFFLLCTCV